MILPRHPTTRREILAGKTPRRITISRTCNKVIRGFSAQRRRAFCSPPWTPRPKQTRRQEESLPNGCPRPVPPYAIQSPFPDFCFSGLFTRTDYTQLSRNDKAASPAATAPHPCPDSFLPTVYFHFHIQSIAMLLTHRVAFPRLFCPIKFSPPDRRSLLIHPTPRHRQTGRREVIS